MYSAKELEHSAYNPSDMSVQGLYYQFWMGSAGVFGLVFGLWQLLTEGYSPRAVLVTVLSLALVGLVALWITKLGVGRR